MTGTWKLVSADSKGIDPETIGKGGTIKGDGNPGESPVLPPTFTLRCDMHGAMVGGDPAVGNRCLIVLLGVDGGKLVSTVVGALDVGGQTYGGVLEPQAFQTEGNTLSVHPDLIQGRVSVPAKTVDAQACIYVFDFQGSIFANLVVGTYTVTAKVSGQPDVTVVGSFDGSIDQGLPKAGPVGQPIHADLKNFVPVQPGEHPRLLFRKADVPALRKKADTPEGKAIVARLRHVLGGTRSSSPMANCGPAPVGPWPRWAMPLAAPALRPAAGPAVADPCPADHRRRTIRLAATAPATPGGTRMNGLPVLDLNAACKTTEVNMDAPVR